MTTNDPLFEGFALKRIETEDAALHVRIGGEGPPLLLLHGFPQTGAMWAKCAPALKQRFTLIIPDLPGYGRSARHNSGAEAGSKRVTARAMVQMMAALGHERFMLAGHDRGGRVAYRTGFDFPEKVEKLAVLDILPTWEYWAHMDRNFAIDVYHWGFLAQPSPFPETLIGAAPDYFIDEKLKSWSGGKTLDCFDPRALEEYRHNARNKPILAAMCDDYRAGASLDVDHDNADISTGRKLTMPLCALWGSVGIAQSAATPLDIWPRWAIDVSGRAVESGHFLAEENPEDTSAALLDFFKA